MSSKVRELTFQEAPTEQVRRAAQSEGMRTLYWDGIDKALKGITTLDEVFPRAALSAPNRIDNKKYWPFPKKPTNNPYAQGQGKGSSTCKFCKDRNFLKAKFRLFLTPHVIERDDGWHGHLLLIDKLLHVVVKRKGERDLHIAVWANHPCCGWTAGYAPGDQSPRGRGHRFPDEEHRSRAFAEGAQRER